MQFSQKQFKKVFGKKLKSDGFVWGMRFTVVFLNLMPLYTMNFEMNEWMENETDKTIIKAMYDVCYLLAMITYFKASFQQPKVVPETVPEDEKHFCKQCKNWKPERAHHCSVCGKCILKMDHHCPWIGNCVGYHNFKDFYLFILYESLMGLIYDVQITRLVFFRPEGSPNTFTIYGTVLYYATNCTTWMIAQALLFMTISVSNQMFNNLTNLEKFSQKQVNFPCLGPVGSFQNIPNEYDMMWLPNLKQVFGSRMWTWLLPINEPMQGQGFYYPQIPELTELDLKIAQNKEGKSRPKDEETHESQAQLKKAMKKYGGKKVYIRAGPQGQEAKEVQIPLQEGADQIEISLN